MNKKIKEYVLSFLGPLFIGVIMIYIIDFFIDHSDLDFIIVFFCMLVGVLIGNGIIFACFDLKKIIKSYRNPNGEVEK